MAFIFVYSPSDFVGGLPDESGAQAAGTAPFTLTLRPDATPTLIEITDDDAVFNEVDATQSLTSTVTIDGTQYLAGTTINTAYDLINTSSGHQVTTFHFGGDGFQQGAVDGLVSSIELVPGTTYTFDQERTSFQQANPYTGFVSCFTSGTAVETATGPVLVETLKPGDLVRTADHGMQPVRVVLKRTLDLSDLSLQPNLLPVLIKAGALGRDLPSQDLTVSPQHRMLVQSEIANRMFGTPDVLVSARKLTGLPGISISVPKGPVTYVHLILDRHEIVFAAGAPTETLYLGPMALTSLEPEALSEVRAVFPGVFDDLEQPASARVIPSGKMQKRLAFRHAKNRKPLLCPRA